VVARAALSGWGNAPRDYDKVTKTTGLVFYSWKTSCGFGHGNPATSAARNRLNPPEACNRRGLNILTGDTHF
jgi:hypothetical protein